MSRSVLATNPVRKLRKAQGNMTIEALASNCGVSKRTVYLVECGVYESIPTDIVQYFVSSTGQDLTSIFVEYDKFRTAMRQFASNTFSDSTWNFIGHVETDSPIHFFYTSKLHLTATAFTQLVLINPGLLTMLVKGDKYKYVPQSIKKALMECGAPDTFIKDLDERTKYHHKKQLNSN